MNTTLTFDNSRLTPVDSTSTLRLYQIPSAKDNGTYSLRITGNNIDPPLELDVKIDNGRIDF